MICFFWSIDCFGRALPKAIYRNQGCHNHVGCRREDDRGKNPWVGSKKLALEQFFGNEPQKGQNARH
jgi:hypothetical protein